jgi:CRP-like cAMP-binding protein
VALSDQSTYRNQLLATLSPASLAALSPHLRPIELLNRAVLQRPNEPIASVLFPVSGYVSMLAALEDGDAVEVGLVGREGMVGIPLALAADRSPLEALVQAEGRALQLDAGVFLARMDEDPSLRGLVLRYVMAFNTQITMTAACNGRHHIEQRLARWLLMVQDRVECDEFPMTHEFMSMMLGVRRAGVTIAAGVLQKAGFISYERGRVRIADRTGLEAAACECHGIVRREFARLLGISSRG